MVPMVTRNVTACYETALKQSAAPQGKIKVGLSGTPGASAITTQASKGLPESLVSCVGQGLRLLLLRPGMASEPKEESQRFTVELHVRAPEPGEPGWYHPPPPNTGGFTLTRLHARYGKDTLGQDLVFREAAAIEGGREDFSSPKEQRHGATPAGSNNFQGRYILRHAWTGPISCPQPRRGIWGGPPGGGEPPPRAALDTAFAPRGKVELASLIREPVPELKLTPSSKAKAEGAVPEPKLAPSSEGKAEGGTSSRGCLGCAVGSEPRARSEGALAALLALAWRARRRRRPAR
jgi:MYXO-CTERM domain-containing protein